MTTPKDLGPPIEWSDEDLDQLSQVTPADAKAAAALWHRDAPGWSKNLIDASPDEPS